MLTSNEQFISEAFKEQVQNAAGKHTWRKFTIKSFEKGDTGGEAGVKFYCTAQALITGGPKLSRTILKGELVGLLNNVCEVG